MVVNLLGAICGSARSMDRAAQSMDPQFAQESMDRARHACAIYRSMDFAYDANQFTVVIPR